MTTTTIKAASRVNLEYVEGDDPSYALTLTLDGAAYDLTGATVRLVLKAGPEQDDADGTTLDSTGAKVTIDADPTSGKVAVDLDAADVDPVMWYVLRVDNAAGRTRTFGYGDLKPVNV